MKETSLRLSTAFGVRSQPGPVTNGPRASNKPPSPALLPNLRLGIVTNPKSFEKRNECIGVDGWSWGNGARPNEARKASFKACKRNMLGWKVQMQEPMEPLHRRHTSALLLDPHANRDEASLIATRLLDRVAVHPCLLHLNPQLLRPCSPEVLLRCTIMALAVLLGS